MSMLHVSGFSILHANRSGNEAIYIMSYIYYACIQYDIACMHDIVLYIIIPCIVDVVFKCRVSLDAFSNRCFQLKGFNGFDAFNFDIACEH